MEDGLAAPPARSRGLSAMPSLLRQRGLDPIRREGNLPYPDAGDGSPARLGSISGRLIRTLVDRRLGRGYHTFTWNATDAHGRQVAAGLYLYRLQAGKRMLVRKTVFAK